MAVTENQMNVVYLLLGSNLGERKRYLESASAMLVGELLPECMQGKRNEAVKCSSVYETEPWGFDSDDLFLNCVVRYLLEEPCRMILSGCQMIEMTMGKSVRCPEFDEKGKRIYRSRIIDIDILFYGEHRIDTCNLKVPHPLMGQRDFVMLPLMEIASERIKESFPEIFGQDTSAPLSMIE